MFKKISIKSIIALCLFVLLFACSKDDPDPINENEAFSRVTLEVTKEGSSNPTTYTFQVEEYDHDDQDQVDHQGEHIKIDLEANATYSVSISFFNISDNITSEIIEEKDEHQFFYDITDELNGFSIVSAANDTEDSNGNPLFLKTIWTTTGETSGVVVGYLIHEPTSKTGSTRNDIGGATDIQIEFEVHVK